MATATVKIPAEPVECVYCGQPLVFIAKVNTGHWVTGDPKKEQWKCATEELPVRAHQPNKYPEFVS